MFCPKPAIEATITLGEEESGKGEKSTIVLLEPIEEYFQVQLLRSNKPNPLEDPLLRSNKPNPLEDPLLRSNEPNPLEDLLLEDNRINPLEN